MSDSTDPLAEAEGADVWTVAPEVDAEAADWAVPAVASDAVSAC